MTVEIKVPDIGDFADVPIIEIHVQPGAKVSVDDPLITLESDKATMDMPAPQPGTVAGMLVTSSARVSRGSPIMMMETDSAAAIPTTRRSRGDASPYATRPERKRLV